ADDRDADAQEDRAQPWQVPQSAGELDEVTGNFLGRRVAARSVDAQELDDRPVQSHDRRGERVDRDLEGEDHRGLAPGLDERRRPSRQPVGLGPRLDDEARGHEFGDQPADRAASQARPRDQLRARQRTPAMELARDRAQVRPPNRLTALTDELATSHGYL